MYVHLAINFHIKIFMVPLNKTSLIQCGSVTVHLFSFTHGRSEDKWLLNEMWRNFRTLIRHSSLEYKFDFLLLSQYSIFTRLNFIHKFWCTLLYLLTARCRVLLDKLTGLQLLTKFPALHGTRRFITALTSVRHLSLTWASPIHSIYPHPTSWRSILILSTHLRLGLPSGLFPYSFPTKGPIHHLSSPIRATCPAHLILFDFITRTILGEEYKTFISSLCSLLQSPVISFLLGPNIFLNTLFVHIAFFNSS